MRPWTRRAYASRWSGLLIMLLRSLHVPKPVCDNPLHIQRAGAVAQAGLRAWVGGPSLQSVTYRNSHTQASQVVLPTATQACVSALRMQHVLYHQGQTTCGSARHSRASGTHAKGSKSRITRPDTLFLRRYVYRLLRAIDGECSRTSDYLCRSAVCLPKL